MSCTISPAAQRAALRNRAREALLFCLIEGKGNIEFWRGMLKAIDSLGKPGVHFLARTDAALPYAPPRFIQAAWAALPEGAELLPAPKVVEILLAQGIELAPDVVAGLQADAVHEVEDRKVATFQGNDESAGVRAEFQDGASRHETSSTGKSASIAQEQPTSGGAA